MPADPIEYRVLLHLQAALRAISIASGYHHDVAAVAVKLDPNQDIETLAGPDGVRPFVVLEVKPEAWDYSLAGEQEQLAPGELHELLLLTLPVTIHWINDSDSAIDESRMQTFFRGCADVEQAIAYDATRGLPGLVKDTRVVRRTYDQLFNSAQVWAMVETEIRILRTHGLPNGA